ncbi:MAG: 30S ribosomal protein S16 [Deltaproteobacteria bacterium]|nr:30S ribosomal protein S16 [Deltaproteobacteria bacterium]
MSVTVRLARGGSKKHPFYRIVAADSRRARDGRFLEKLGTYDPNGDPAQVTLKRDRFDFWVKNGAQVSPTVKSVVKQLPAQA